MGYRNHSYGKTFKWGRKLLDIAFALHPSQSHSPTKQVPSTSSNVATPENGENSHSPNSDANLLTRKMCQRMPFYPAYNHSSHIKLCQNKTSSFQPHPPSIRWNKWKKICLLPRMLGVICPKGKKLLGEGDKESWAPKSYTLKNLGMTCK